MIKLNPYQNIEKTIEHKLFEVKADTDEYNIDKLISLGERRHDAYKASKEKLDGKVVLLLSFLLGFVSLAIFRISDNFSRYCHQPLGVFLIILTALYSLLSVYVAYIGFMPKPEIPSGYEPANLENLVNLERKHFKLSYLTSLQYALDFNSAVHSKYAVLFARAINITVLSPITGIILAIACKIINLHCN